MLPMTWPQQVVGAVSLGAVYALFAVGYAMLFGLLDVLNLVHAAIFMAGALTAWWLLTVVLLPIPAALLLAALLAGLLGLVADRFAFAPLRRRAAPPLRSLLAGLALAAIGQGLALGFFGPESHTYPGGVLPPGDFTAGSVVAGWLQPLAPAAAIVLVLLVRWLMQASRYALALRAIAENPPAARLLGIDVERLITQTFFLASALGGVAGTLFALSVNSAAVGMDQPVELRGLAIIILGGIGSVPGAIVGGFALALIEVFGVPVVGAQYRDAIPFAVLFLVLTLRPSGLLGRYSSWGAA